MSNIIFNLNEPVQVVLTAEGAVILNREFKRWRPSSDKVWEEGDIYEEQLHEMMFVFGPHINMALRSPIETELRLLDG